MKTRLFVIHMPLSLMTIVMKKKFVAVLMDKVLMYFVKGKNPNVEEVHIFSDGPSSQFKKIYMVQLLHTFQKNLGARILWHYFATSHGKGAVDELGGTVKRTVWNAVSTRKVQSVTSAECFAVVAQQFCQSTDITVITRKATEKVSKKLNLEKAFGNAKPVPEIKQVPFHGGRSQDEMCKSVCTHRKLHILIG